MDPAERERATRMLAEIHTILLTGLIVFRPLVWDGAPASPANLVYLALIMLALLVLTLELATGLRTHLRWSWLGVGFAVLVGASLPVALRAPLASEGWSWWWQLLLHLGLGAYVLQVIGGRERVAWTALVAAVAAETVVSLVQGCYVLPAMAAVTTSSDIGAAAEGIAAADLSERIANGGWFGTFTLSNTLAAWLMVAALPIVGLVRQRPWLAGTLLAAAGTVFLSTRSKGALLVLTVVASTYWLIQVRHRWWRWLPLGAAVMIGVAIWLLPHVQAGLQASAQVRLGYWLGASKLVQEAPWFGHGWAAFSERAGGVLPLWAEPSRMVHNEVLEIAVSGGIPLALLVAGLLTAVAWPRRRDQHQRELAGNISLSPVGAVVVVTFSGYLGMLGMLEGNTGWWCLGDTIVGQALWSLLIGISAVLMITKLHLPIPRGWFFRLGLAALAVHSLTDFNLHSFAVIGTLLIVAILAGGERREIRCGQLVGTSLVTLVIGIIIGVVTWAGSALAREELQDRVRELRLLNDPTHGPEVLARMAEVQNKPPPAPGDRREADALIAETVSDVLQSAGNEPDIMLQACSFLPPSADRAARLDQLRARLPYNSTLAQMRSDDYVHAGDYVAAIAELRRASALAPAQQAIRQQLVALYDRAINADPMRALRWKTERDAVEAERVALESQVYFRYRSALR